MRLASILMLFSLTEFLSAQQPLTAQHWIELGDKAYRVSNYPEAVHDLQQALTLDPSNQLAMVRLGSIYMTMWIPGLPSEDNEQNLRAARKNLQLALQLHPTDKEALAYLAQLTYTEAMGKKDAQVKTLGVALDLFRQLAELDPANKEAFYMQGVIDWSLAFAAVQKERLASGLNPEQTIPIPDLVKRNDLRESYGVITEDGIQNLKRALQLDPDYADAMSYMNLLLRVRTAIDSTQAEADRDRAEADRWVRDSIAIQQRQSGSPAGGSINPATPIPAPPPVAGTLDVSTNQELRIASSIAENNLIRKVQPAYPIEAKTAGVQGRVVYTVHIAPDGTVTKLDLVSGHPLLLGAARDAIGQWLYKPTLLNGQPTAVITDIVITFTLQP